MSTISKQGYATKKAVQLKGLIDQLAKCPDYDQNKKTYKKNLTLVLSDFIETMVLEGDAFNAKIDRSTKLDENYLK